MIPIDIREMAHVVKRLAALTNDLSSAARTEI